MNTQSSPPGNTPRGSKRQRSPSRRPAAVSTATPRANPSRRASDSSLPPSSPLAPFSDTDDSLDERDNVPDVDAGAAEDDEEGEDLFGETLEEYVLLSRFLTLP